MIEKQITVDQIIVLNDGQIQIRERTTVLEDSVELSHSYHRRVFVPGSVIEGDQRVKDIAAVVHTPQVITDFLEAELQRRLDNR